MEWKWVGGKGRGGELVMVLNDGEGDFKGIREKREMYREGEVKKMIEMGKEGGGIYEGKESKKTVAAEGGVREGRECHVQVNEWEWAKEKYEVEEAHDIRRGERCEGRKNENKRG